MYALYTSVLTIGLVLSLPYYLLRFSKYGSSFMERLGFVAPETEAATVWIHAVSVGEAKMVDGLIDGLRELFPGKRVVVSTITATGRTLVLEREGIDRVIYFPLDLPGIVRRALDRVRPALIVVAETEIWPNFLRECNDRKIPVFMVNGRISDRSYPRYRLVRPWLGRVLEGYSLLGMQSEADAERIRALGAPAKAVAVFGNLKYDLVSSTRQLDALLGHKLSEWQPLLVAASTTQGEEPLLVQAFRRLRQTHPELKLLIAPRHPERFREVGELIASSDLTCQRRSGLTSESESADVLLLDTIGELASVFEFATLVFVGGSLVPRGGHNILEPARFSKPVIFGPHMENFRDISHLFLAARAAMQVADADSLAEVIADLLNAPAAATQMGSRGRRLVEENAGATRRFLGAMRVALSGAGR